MNFVDNGMISKKQRLFVTLIKKQRKNIPNIGNYGRLSFDDIKRIDRYITDNIFDENNKCCLYRGELKKSYATISFRSRKVSVHRILYHNYIGNILPNDYIIFTCKNKGVCCKLSHFMASKKKKYVSKTSNNSKKNKNKK